MAEILDWMRATNQVRTCLILAIYGRLIRILIQN